VDTTTKGSRRHPNKRRRRHEIGTAAGCAIFIAASGSALAQDPGSDEVVEEIVVSGLRKSIQDSINVKKEDSSIVEVVSAEDIGKLPDASIAESIGRLPGIAAQRTNGRAQTLSIRGLGPDFTVTTFNGREQASTNDNRTVEFDQFPSELVSQVRVYKTPDASMSYQGIAGTTDIQTVHPLAFDERKLAFGYKREINEQDANIPGLPDAGDRVNATYIDQFADNTVGVAFGVAYNKTPYQAQTREPWGYPELPSGDMIIAGDKDGVKSAFYKRTALMGVLEFAPNDQLRMMFDGYHSDFQELQTIQRMEYGTVVWGGATLTDPGPVENDRVQSGTFTNVPFVVIENYNNNRDASVDAFGLNTDFKFNENWSMNGDLSWSKVDREDLRLESTAGNGSGQDPANAPTPDTIPFTTGSDGRSYFTPTLNYSDYSEVMLGDPGGWGGGPRRAGFVEEPDITDEIKAIRLSASRKLEGFLSEVSFGANYADRTKEKSDMQSNLWLPGNVSLLAVPEEYRTGIANSSFFGSPYGIIGYNAIAMYNDDFWEVINNVDDPNANPNDRANTIRREWKVNEKLTTLYVQLGIDTELGDLPLRGNIGVQSVTADQTSYLNLANTQGLPPNPPTIPVTTVVEGDKYTDILPSLNLALFLPHDMKLRLGAATTVARPRLDELGGGASYTVTSDQVAPPTYNGTPYYWTRSGGGNPLLQPWKANTFDLSFEKYFSTKGYVSLAAYYKDLKTYIFNQSVVESFDDVPVPTVQPGDPTTYTQADANRMGVSTLKQNGSGGYVQGFEVTASIPFDLFADSLEGFGIIASGAWNKSSIEINNVDTPIPGLSDEIFNTTLYYERFGFSARVSNRYRGTFLGEVPLFEGTLDLKQVASESILDAQIGYNFETGALKGLSLAISGTNLTDERFLLSNAEVDPYHLVKYEEYGAIYALAISYTF
jgi:iron complex outermembrane receptor protein